MKRILFLVEAVTLAHVVRPLVLARSLNPNLYEIYWASEPRYQSVVGKVPFATRLLHSINCDRFLEIAADGKYPYDASIIREYVREEIKLIEEIKPDVVISDFRHSAIISTQVTNVPCITITSAYWSPYSLLQLPIPEHAFQRFLGAKLCSLLYPIAIKPMYSLFFARYSLPVNQVLQEYGLASLKLDLRHVHTAGNYTLYADIPELIPTSELPVTHRFIGPILWSPNVTLPTWWNKLPNDKPIIYLSLGSSGRQELLPSLLEKLSKLKVTVIAITAGRSELTSVPDNAFITEYISGQEAVNRANLIICNGGSPTTYQALAAGKPVIGIASNVDQYLNMQAICSAGAGLLVRSDSLNASTLTEAVMKILSQPRYTQVAQHLAEKISRYDAVASFHEIVSTATASWQHHSQPMLSLKEQHV